jgi:hypothetical protein
VGGGGGRGEEGWRGNCDEVKSTGSGEVFGRKEAKDAFGTF